MAQKNRVAYTPPCYVVALTVNVYYATYCIKQIAYMLFAICLHCSIAVYAY